MKSRGWSTLTLLAVFVIGVRSHGRLMDPPARNAMWRLGYPNPVNYNDNELYCGGFVVHYQKNGGKCGVCGDDYREKTPRDHEAGGYFANGIIVKTYVPGQMIDIKAELTTNHYGYMEVKLCPHNNHRETITQECLDRYLLPMADGNTRFVIPRDTGKIVTFDWQVKLPDDITCTNCVLQWKYFAGNTWGKDKTGNKGAVGLGPQETFINCADITIQSNTPSFPTGGSNQIDNPWLLYFHGSFPGMKRDQSVKPLPNGLIPLIVRSQLCIPINDYADVDKMHDWCRINCLKYPPNCPADVCLCVTECVAIGEFKEEDPDNDIFCHQECLGYPSNCPKDKCHCY